MNSLKVLWLGLVHTGYIRLFKNITLFILAVSPASLTMLGLFILTKEPTPMVFLVPLAYLFGTVVSGILLAVLHVIGKCWGWLQEEFLRVQQTGKYHYSRENYSKELSDPNAR